MKRTITGNYNSSAALEKSALQRYLQKIMKKNKNINYLLNNKISPPIAPRKLNLKILKHLEQFSIEGNKRHNLPQNLDIRSTKQNLKKEKTICKNIKLFYTKI
ncbi:hypothetical protein [Microbulbifer sp. ZKSA002]|uniref:hypothetical protein n=1 Tax=Microbulbifer sp. ZKSA002 TaxID=3243388 RepID=UPI00403A6879